MKYALFDFVDEKSCEIGESRWIVGEDPEFFDNDNWVSNKIVLLEWPNEFSSKKIVKFSIDPKAVETTSYTAKVVKFGDEYEAMRRFMTSYVKTGSIQTPNHGRGQRVPKRNAKYDDSDSEEMCPPAKVLKKPKETKTNHSFHDDEVQRVREKYNLGSTKKKLSEGDNDSIASGNDASDSSDSEETINLKKENVHLKKMLQKKECEIKHLENVIRNMKDIPLLHEVALEFRKQISHLKLPSIPKQAITKSSPSSTSASTMPSSGSSSSVSKTVLSGSSCSNTSSSEGETEELVTICPHVKITKKQYIMLKSKGSTKEFVYAMMAMLWSRDIIAKHSISGKASNAFKEREAKPQLDPEKVQSICEYVAKKFGCKETEVKQIMTAKVNNIAKVLKAQQRMSNVVTTC